MFVRFLSRDGLGQNETTIASKIRVAFTHGQPGILAPGSGYLYLRQVRGEKKWVFSRVELN